MTVLINIARLAMLTWALYALLLIFVPAFIRQPPDRIGGALQFVAAYAIGWALDRLLGVIRRRQAARVAATVPAADTGAL